MGAQRDPRAMCVQSVLGQPLVGEGGHMPVVMIGSLGSLLGVSVLRSQGAPLPSTGSWLK